MVSGWRARLTGGRGVATAGVAAAALVLALVGISLAGAFADPGGGTAAPGPRSSGPHSSRPHSSRPATTGGTKPARPIAKPGRAGSSAPAGVGHGGARRGATKHDARAHARAPALRTSCHSVAHIGDSTSVGMISPESVPNPALRLAARYADVGVASTRVDAAGGRSIVEILPGQVNGYNVARAWASEGYRGCWVFALGTNDTANVSVGSALGRMARIERMMSAAHGEPVLWVDLRTQLDSGPWAESNMRTWNETLRQACARHPNMRILDWASLVNPGWFNSDGIHYTSAGFADRAQAIADALARAFPRNGRSPGCVVM